MNERDFPHVVELALPPGGFRGRSSEFEAFHRELGIPIRRGRGRHEAEQFHVRFCFPHATAADAFRDRFGGERLTYTPQKPRPRALKLKSKRIYAPRIVTDSRRRGRGDHLRRLANIFPGRRPPFLFVTSDKAVAGSVPMRPALTGPRAPAMRTPWPGAISSRRS
jgi:hypothetical protein